MALMLLMVSFILEILQQKHNSRKGSLQIEMGDHFGSLLHVFVQVPGRKLCKRVTILVQFIPNKLDTQGCALRKKN